MIYVILKNLHVSCVVISVTLFVYRYFRLRRFPNQPLATPLKVLPHVNDTILLSAAIGMLIVVGLNPLDTPWLLAKITALLLYIGFGMACFKAATGSQRRSQFFILALLAFAYIVLVALTKSVLPIWPAGD